MHTIHHVAEFHRTFGHPIADGVNAMTPELRALRVRLIAEELAELCTAWGVKLTMDIFPDTAHTAIRVQPIENWEVNHVEGADALGDLDYVVQGANLVAGYPAEQVVGDPEHGIQASNMSKLGEDGKPIYREDGKILKGPNYRKPDIAAILAKYPDGYGAHTHREYVTRASLDISMQKV